MPQFNVTSFPVERFSRSETMVICIFVNRIRRSTPFCSGSTNGAVVKRVGLFGSCLGDIWWAGKHRGHRKGCFPFLVLGACPKGFPRLWLIRLRAPDSLCTRLLYSRCGNGRADRNCIRKLAHVQDAVSFLALLLASVGSRSLSSPRY